MVAIGEGLTRVALSKLHSCALAGADLPELAPGEEVPASWITWLGQLDTALEHAERLSIAADPGLHRDLGELRTRLDRSVRYAPGSPLLVDGDDAQAVAVQAMRRCEDWTSRSSRAG